MRHIKQSTSYSCGAASLAAILNISEEESAFIAKTKKSGTNTFNICNALKNRGIKNKSINVNLPFQCVFTHLKLLSKEYPIYVSAEFISNSGKGRNSIRRHAIAIKNEKVFDPAENFELPIDSIHHLYNKDLIIKEIILVGIE